MGRVIRLAYAGRGWQLWRGPTFALTPAGIRRTEDDDNV
jgi:aminoglycoside 2'-N-acetyltransferase I